MEYHLEYHDGYLDAKTSGDAEADGFADLLDSMLGHADWKPGGSMLLDHTDLDAEPLTGEDIGKIAQSCADRRVRLGCGRLAIVATRDLQFGLARMWAARVEGRWDMVADLFRTRAAAIAWLTG